MPRSKNEEGGTSQRFERLELLERLEPSAPNVQIAQPVQEVLRDYSFATMKIIKIEKALKGLREINREIRYKNCFEEKTFSSGLIAFRSRKDSDPKQVNHDDKDVVCHVLKGSGRLNVNGHKIRLRSGMICHIPKGTPHDFAAGKNGDLVLFYSLIKTRSSATVRRKA